VLVQFAQTRLVILSEAKDLCNLPAAPQQRQIAQVLRFAQDDKTVGPVAVWTVATTKAKS